MAIQARTAKQILRWTVSSFLAPLLVANILMGCNASTNSPSASPVASGQPVITAAPNPVPAGGGKGETTITWRMADDSVGQVYVSVNGKKERLFAVGPSGSKVAPWIDTGATYTFYLVPKGEKGKHLAEVQVTRVRR